jgi:hypothetical protein
MKYLLALLFLMGSLCSNGQIAYGLIAGPQVTSSHYVVRDLSQKNHLKYGFQFGGMLKIPFESNLYFVPMGFYSLKGYKVDFTRFAFPPDTSAVNNNTRIHTFELATLLEVELNSNPSHFFIRGGPSADFQLTGHENFDRKNAGPVSRTMKFSFADYGHFGFNLLAHFGYESEKGYSIFLQYTYGVGSINNADNGPQIFHRAFGISFGYLFHKERITGESK